MTGFLKRLGNLFGAKANQAISAAESNAAPELAQKLIDEMDAKITEAENALTSVVAQLELIRGDLEIAVAEQTKWEKAVLTASDKGDDQLLNECAAKLQEAEANFASLTSQEDQMEETANTLQKQVDKLLSERNRSANTVRTMTVQHKIAKAQKTVANAMSSADMSNQTGELARLHRKVQEQAAEGRAAMSQGSRRTGSDLIDRVNAASAESPADIVARLKAAKK